MTASEAIPIVLALMDGQVSHTQQRLSNVGVLENEKVAGALSVAVTSLKLLERRQSRNLPLNAGEPWSDEEDRQVCDGFDAGSTIADLAAQHGRTERAICCRLLKLGRIHDSASLTDGVAKKNNGRQSDGMSSQRLPAAVTPLTGWIGGGLDL